MKELVVAKFISVHLKYTTKSKTTLRPPKLFIINKLSFSEKKPRILCSEHTEVHQVNTTGLPGY